MKKYIKKLLSKKFVIPSPEEVLNKKAILLFMVALALFYDILILGYAKSLPVAENTIKTKITTPLEKNINSLVAGYPMEKMAPYISAKEKRTAAFLIGIAKKESNWGKYSPKLNGKDCFNYWGYRGQGENVTPSGYTCFDSPKQAVDIVGKRISTLINDSNLSTPEEMIVWKCGWNCAGHSSESVDKWIADVGIYYNKVYQ
ncbi:MAG: hypothetical protein US30_C0003G0021 [Candidatus Moranbacteria bacterium GW2011_GWF2_36_839]|nr:MAG: hypothetical protein US27_C0004G0021 [Candidatus Moranbacteria bacterium GW2011_GWF1_36_78]KKQ17454.1 MAG: hypothetical protein US30_C0003G0021 [Candidatus Moranbacteria bacterium GW2011_GWF2_36_839]HAT73921.1 hypothetical protein [Candidatus Moranbacteria bacterium]HBY10553.1 hypothetical protein [Candidatus Moranbacteria bacterium]